MRFTLPPPPSAKPLIHFISPTNLQSPETTYSIMRKWAAEGSEPCWENSLQQPVKLHCSWAITAPLLPGIWFLGIWRHFLNGSIHLGSALVSGRLVEVLRFDVMPPRFSTSVSRPCVSNSFGDTLSSISYMLSHGIVEISSCEITVMMWHKAEEASVVTGGDQPPAPHVLRQWTPEP